MELYQLESLSMELLASLPSASLGVMNQTKGAGISAMNQRPAPKKPALQDWHRADIVAALRKAGWSLRKLATHHGYKQPTTLIKALDRPWPKGERLIASAIGVAPEAIWPSRYLLATKDSSSPTRTSPVRRSNSASGAA